MIKLRTQFDPRVEVGKQIQVKSQLDRRLRNVERRAGRSPASGADAGRSVGNSGHGGPRELTAKTPTHAELMLIELAHRGDIARDSSAE